MAKLRKSCISGRYVLCTDQLNEMYFENFGSVMQWCGEHGYAAPSRSVWREAKVMDWTILHKINKEPSYEETEEGKLNSIAANLFYGFLLYQKLPFKAFSTVNQHCKNNWMYQAERYLRKDKHSAYSKTNYVTTRKAKEKLPDEFLCGRSCSAGIHTDDCKHNYGEGIEPINDAKKKETDMSIKVTTPTLINGRGADDYSVNELITLMRHSEAVVKDLEGISTDSKTVKALIAREQKGIARVVAILDSRKLTETD